MLRKSSHALLAANEVGTATVMFGPGFTDRLTFDNQTVTDMT